MDIKIKRIRRQCFVPGCRNFDTFIVSGNGEFTPDVILCQECIDKIYNTIHPTEEKTEDE